MIDGIPIEQVNAINFLGVNIDNKLTWVNHINKIHSKIAKNIGILKKRKAYLRS